MMKMEVGQNTIHAASVKGKTVTNQSAITPCQINGEGRVVSAVLCRYLQYTWILPFSLSATFTLLVSAPAK